MAANLSTHFNVAQHLQWWQIYEAKKKQKKTSELASPSWRTWPQLAVTKMASKILKRKPTHVGTSEGSKSFIKILLNHRCQCITHQHKHTLKQVTQTTVLSEVTQWKFFWFYFGIHPVWAQSPLTATQRPLPLWISLGSTPVRPTRFCWTNIETVCHEQDHQLQRWSPGQRTRLVCPVSAGWCGTKQRTTN